MAISQEDEEVGVRRSSSAKRDRELFRYFRKRGGWFEKDAVYLSQETGKGGERCKLFPYLRKRRLGVLYTYLRERNPKALYLFQEKILAVLPMF